MAEDFKTMTYKIDIWLKETFFLQVFLLLVAFSEA